MGQEKSAGPGRGVRAGRDAPVSRGLLPLKFIGSRLSQSPTDTETGKERQRGDHREAERNREMETESVSGRIRDSER